MQERENVFRILKEGRKALEKEDADKLKGLSDQTNNTAARTHDGDNIAVAVIVYSLSKVVERKQYHEYSGWSRFYKNVLVYFDKAIKNLEGGNDEKVRDALNSIRKEINNLSGTLRKYIKDVFRKAQINKASKIYEHGISMEKTAKLLGITLWELASYAGQKVDGDIGRGVSARDRVNVAEGIFG